MFSCMQSILQDICCPSNIVYKYKICAEGIDCFKYIGLKISQDHDNYILAQEDYSEMIKELPLTTARRTKKETG